MARPARGALATTLARLPSALLVATTKLLATNALAAAVRRLAATLMRSRGTALHTKEAAEATLTTGERRAAADALVAYAEATKVAEKDESRKLVHDIDKIV